MTVDALRIRRTRRAVYGPRVVAAAGLARQVGFDFVDIKACHGYLLHEFLSARRRAGRFGGDLAGRTRVLTTIIERVLAECPGLAVGVRLSVFDSVPFRTSREIGQPWPFADYLPYELGFGVDQRDPLAIDLAEPIEHRPRVDGSIVG